MLATLERIATQGHEREIIFILPSDEEVRVYLRQAGIFEAMREYVTIRGDQPEDLVPERPPIRPMVSCTHFHTGDDVDRLAAEMEHRFSTDFLGHGTLLQPCYGIFSELAENVVFHAESDGGHVLTQQYNYRGGPVVDIAVADSGIGMLSSLSKNCEIGPLSSDSEAIMLALKEGVTSLSDSHRGYGLSYVAENVNAARDRSMTIRSGRGIITIQGDGTVQKADSETLYPGTIINVRIPC